MSDERNNLQETERTLYQSLRDAGRLIPLTIEDVRASEAQFDGAAIQLPAKLSCPTDVFARIKSHEGQNNSNSRPQIFGRLIQMLRTERGLSVSDLAGKARIDIEELRRIEGNTECQAKPRTVSQLAEVFGVVPKSLARVANLTQQVDEQLAEGVVRFAACAKDMDKLSREQKRALRSFVKLLNSMK